ncbi:hypothetical protein R1flu_006778 [Riccia fluitans]|uniref:Uncharacterized protein n=1 Tax=Riccia fluitans TaxID=41844 RepID=A0ABD1YWZ6_9MARC
MNANSSRLGAWRSECLRLSVSAISFTVHNVSTRTPRHILSSYDEEFEDSAACSVSAGGDDFNLAIEDIVWKSMNCHICAYKECLSTECPLLLSFTAGHKVVV